MATSPHGLRMQVMSDIHLERYPGDSLPTVAPSAPVLALLGDIGNAVAGPQGDKLRAFLTIQSEAFEQASLQARPTQPSCPAPPPSPPARRPLRGCLLKAHAPGAFLPCLPSHGARVCDVRKISIAILP